MKKILFLGCAFFLFAAATQAQSTDTTATPQGQNMHHRRGAGMMGNRGDLAKKLNLSSDQQTQLKTLNDSFKKDREAIKSDASLSDDQKKQAYKDLFKKNSDARQAIYTPEQKAIIAKEMQNRHGKRGQHKMNATKAMPDQQ